MRIRKQRPRKKEKEVQECNYLGVGITSVGRMQAAHTHTHTYKETHSIVVTAHISVLCPPPVSQGTRGVIQCVCVCVCMCKGVCVCVCISPLSTTCGCADAT